MANRTKFLHFKTSAGFQTEIEKNSGLTGDAALTSTSNGCYYFICFIQETDQIYTHGNLYDCATYDDTEIRGLISSLTSVVETKADISALTDLSNEVEENEEVTAAALTDLKETKADKTEIPDVSDFVTTDELNALSAEVENKVDSSDFTTLSETVAGHTTSINNLSNNKADKTVLGNYVTTSTYNSKISTIESSLNNKAEKTALNSYYTKTESDDKYALKTSLGSYASVEYVDNQIGSVSDDINAVSTEVTNLKTSHNTLSETVSTINSNYLSKTDAEKYIDSTELSNAVDDLEDKINLKQNTLVSGTSIKTINSTSLLGSGNITTPDTKVTSAANHYGYAPSNAISTTGAFVTKITKDAANHVTSFESRSLTATDIPTLDASKITSGTISIERLPAGALERMFVVASETAAMSASVQEGDVVQVTGNSNKMYFCVSNTATTFATKFKEFTAGTATSVPWSGITSKPDGIDGWGDRISVIEGDYFKSSSFTQSNIKSTLGISDWALASVKPTYTASEVGALKQDTTRLTIDLDSILTSGTAILSPFFQVVSGTNVGSARKGVLRMSYNGSESQILFDHYNRILRYRTIGDNPKDWAVLAFTSDLPTKLSQLTDDVVAGKYLPLSGGTLTGNLSAPTFIGNLTGNADTATKLATSRKVWGQSFDGTADVDGDLTLNGGVLSYDSTNGYWNINGNYLTLGTNNGAIKVMQGGSIYIISPNTNTWARALFVTQDDQKTGITTIAGALCNYNTLKYLYYGGVWNSPSMVILPSGNVGIGTTAPTAKLEVDGDVKSSGYVHASTYFTNSGLTITSTSNDDIATTFRTTVFGNSTEGSRIKVFRTGGSAISTFFPGNYAASIAFATGDTHAFLSIPYSNGRTHEAMIGAGNHDVIQWSAELVHSLNVSKYARPADWTPDSVNAASVLKSNVTDFSSGKFWYTYGQLALGEEDGNAYEGTSSNYKLYSFPSGGTTKNDTAANIQNLRLSWSDKYFHDIFMSPNYGYVWHRWVHAGTAKEWSKFVLENNGENDSYVWNINTYASSKLTTARTIWGQSFDGTNNVSGALTSVLSITSTKADGGTYPQFRIMPYDASAALLFQIASYDGTSKSGKLEITGWEGNALTSLYINSSKTTISGPLSVSNGITLTGTSSAAASTIAFSRTTYNYITSPSGSNIGIHPGGLAIGTTAGYKFSSTSFNPGVTNTYDLGTSTLGWKDVYAAGTMYATDFSTTSDARLKEFVSDVNIDFNALKSIPKKYYYWNDKSMGEDLQIGTSAQELMKVYPECVSYDKDQDRYSVNYQKLSVVALAAIDKLHERISELEKKIND